MHSADSAQISTNRRIDREVRDAEIANLFIEASCA